MNNKPVIYADCAAQSRPREEALAAAAAALGHYGNPSGVHRRSSKAARMIFDARRRVAAAINAQPADICFVSSATEANNMAILSAAREGVKRGRTRLLVFSGEHHAVLDAARNACDLTGASVELIPCLSNGTADLAAFEKMCGEDVCLCALMSVNNETGVIQPVEEFARIAHACGALVLTDAAQSAGHLPTDVAAMGCDMLSMSAHKFGGIPGAGVLFCRNGLSLSPLIAGGGQESGRRSGTEALPAICAMGAAITASVSAMEEEKRRVEILRDRFEGLLEHPDIHFVGRDAVRIPSVSCICVRGADGEALALHLDREGICASSGAACTTGKDSASHVLLAMSIPPQLARGSLRFSFDAQTTEEEIDTIARALLTLISSGAGR